MVYYSQSALADLEEIFEGLLSWPKHNLEYNHVVTYHNELRSICDSLDTRTYHFEANFESHKKFGKKVYSYNRNKNTTWYIIYEVDITTNTIYIQHITSNHITISE
jgi:hypothetical protein